MKHFAVALWLGIGLLLVGCGTSDHSGNINGSWTATLTDANGAQMFSFATSFTQSGNGSLSITNFQFSTSSPCFVSGETETGSFALSGNFNGNVSGTFGMHVQSATPAGNILTLAGTVSGNTISGTWTLTGGSGCSGNGKFTMTRM